MKITKNDAAFGLTGSEYTAFIPCYDNGNAVITVKRDGQAVTINKGIKSVIKILLREKSLDFHSIKMNFSRCIDRKSLIPIPLGLDRVLIPVKVRKTISINDGAFAYVDVSGIKEISGDKAALITLTGGYEINCMESVRTVKSMINMANLVNEKFTSGMIGGWSFKKEMSDEFLEYNKPATKADIIMLAYEIMKLRDSFLK